MTADAHHRLSLWYLSTFFERLAERRYEAAAVYYVGWFTESIAAMYVRVGLEPPAWYRNIYDWADRVAVEIMTERVLESEGEA